MDKKLRQLQLTELEILKEIDRFCKNNNIAYSLYAGTLIGAVRHKGFIPWDDDLDICMSRAEYNRFLDLWEKNPPKGYVLQNKDNSPSFSQSFSKVRKDHTTFLQQGETPGDYHTGIFVDVFPIDRIPKGWFARQIFIWRCMRYQLYTREYAPSDNGKIIKLISEILLKTNSSKTRAKKRNKLLSKVTKYNSDSQLSTVAIETNCTLRVPLPPTLMDEFVSLEFEGCRFQCMKSWDECLRIKYSDYMQLPPVEEQTWKHHPQIIDFENNYENLKIDEETLKQKRNQVE